MFKFKEGACVALKNDNPALGLTVGETGTIWALYDTQPPAYEVTFQVAGGEEFDVLMYEEELMEPGNEQEIALQRSGQTLASV